MNITYRYACCVKTVVLIVFYFIISHNLRGQNPDSTDCMVSPETGYALGENNLSGSVESRHTASSPVGVATRDPAPRGALGESGQGICNRESSASPAQLTSDRKAVSVMAALSEDVTHSSSPPFTSGQTLSVKKGDASCPKRIMDSRASNGSVSVQPVDAAKHHFAFSDNTDSTYFNSHEETDHELWDTCN